MLWFDYAASNTVVVVFVWAYVVLATAASMAAVKVTCRQWTRGLGVLRNRQFRVCVLCVLACAVRVIIYLEFVVFRVRDTALSEMSIHWLCSLGGMLTFALYSFLISTWQQALEACMWSVAPSTTLLSWKLFWPFLVLSLVCPLFFIPRMRDETHVPFCVMRGLDHLKAGIFCILLMFEFGSLAHRLRNPWKGLMLQADRGIYVRETSSLFRAFAVLCIISQLCLLSEGAITGGVAWALLVNHRDMFAPGGPGACLELSQSQMPEHRGKWAVLLLQVVYGLVHLVPVAALTVTMMFSNRVLQMVRRRMAEFPHRRGSRDSQMSGSMQDSLHGGGPQSEENMDTSIRHSLLKLSEFETAFHGSEPSTSAASHFEPEIDRETTASPIISFSSSAEPQSSVTQPWRSSGVSPLLPWGSSPRAGSLGTPSGLTSGLATGGGSAHSLLAGGLLVTGPLEPVADVSDESGDSNKSSKLDWRQEQ